MSPSSHTRAIQADCKYQCKPRHVRIHCPSTNTTYDGYIQAPPEFEEEKTDKDSHHYHIFRNRKKGGGPYKISSRKRDKDGSDTQQVKASYIKHGKGTIYDHVTGTTLCGYFENDQVVGCALQTLYDHRVRRLMAQYEGSFLYLPKSASHVPHGKGKYIWQTTNDVYSGEFHKGEMHGIGTFIWGSTGDWYQGLFKKGMQHGKGGKKYSLKSGEIFEGQWKKGQAHGWGKKNFGNGDVFEGMYSRDMRHGYGIYIWNNGDTYAGHWECGSISARGVKSLTTIDGENSNNDNVDHLEGNATQTLLPGGYAEVYNGEFKEDQAQGNGVKRYACGDVYYGSFYNDKRHGYGVYTWSNGDFYEGYFFDGFCSGQGMKHMANGDIYDGEWAEDRPCGYGVKSFGLSGCTYMGFFKNDERHGHGHYRWANGDEYVGDFVDGDQNGWGEYKWHNSNVYKGHWSHGRKDGPGFMKVRVRNIERICYEIWLNGRCIYRETMFFTPWDDLPLLDHLRSKQMCLDNLIRERWIARI